MVAFGFMVTDGLMLCILVALGWTGLFADSEKVCYYRCGTGRELFVYAISGSEDCPLEFREA